MNDINIEQIVAAIGKLITREDLKAVQVALNTRGETRREEILDELNPGDRVVVTDPDGRIHRGTIIKTMQKNVRVKFNGIEYTASPWALTKIEEDR